MRPTPRKTVILTTIFLALAVTASPAPGAPKPFSAADEASIRNLFASYTHALDFGQSAKMAEFFAPGATVSNLASNHQPMPIEKALQAGVADIKGVRHYVSNILITSDTAVVKVTTAALVTAETPRQGAGVSGVTAFYNDTLVKTASGWKFKTREFWTGSENNAQLPVRSALTPNSPTILPAPTTLSAADYSEIYRLYAAFALAGDTADGAAQASLFASGATFSSSTTNHAPEPVAALFKPTSEGARRARPVGSQLIANISLSLTKTGVRGECYAIVFSGENGANGALKATLAVYDDTLVKTSAGWRFKTREVWTGLEKLPPPDFTNINLKNANAAMGVGTAVAKKTPAAQVGAVRPLTLQDRFEIEQLYSTYGFGVDTGDGPRRASAFAPDGTITSNLTDHHPGTMADMIARTARIGRTPRPMGGHTFFNIALTPTAEGASGISYALLTNNSKPEEGVLHGTPAIYVDTFVRTSQGWRIKDREIWLDNEEISPYRPGACSQDPCTK